MVSNSDFFHNGRGKPNSFAKSAICRFGPGGRYERSWPSDSAVGKYEQLDLAGPFGALGLICSGLISLAGRLAVAAGILGSKGKSQAALPPVKFLAGYGPVKSAGRTIGTRRKVNVKYEKAEIAAKGLGLQYNPDPSPVGGRPSNPVVPQQQWLFPDAAGDGQAARRQQGDRIRARRSPRSKRPVTPASQQGSLFEY